MISKPKFPILPKHKEEYIDANKVIWIYDAIQNNWLQRDIVKEVPNASATQNGLVDPETYNKLVELQESTKGLDLTTLKIVPGINAYYYYFYSPDGLIEIKHEGNSQIRVELNEQKLVSLLYKYVCSGDRGIQGAQGTQGERGITSGQEPNFLLNIGTNNSISGQVYVPIPVGTYVDSEEITKIALRIYETEIREELNGAELRPQLTYWTTLLSNPLVNDEEKQLISLLRQASIDQSLGTREQNLDLSPEITSNITTRIDPILWVDVDPITSDYNIVSELVDINSINIEFDQTIGLLKFEIDGNFPDNLIYKARQRGPRGHRGNSPSNFLEQKECQFPEDSNVRPDQVLTNLRLDCDENKIYASYSRLESQEAFSLVSTDIAIDSAATLPTLEGNYVAVQKTSGTNKRTSRLNKDLPELVVDEPNLINWEPQAGCSTQRRFLDHNFDWVPLTNVPKCSTELQWYGPNEVRRGMYPYEILIPLEPPTDKCCQDTFFIFPETGDIDPIPCNTDDSTDTDANADTNDCDAIINTDCVGLRGVFKTRRVRNNESVLGINNPLEEIAWCGTSINDVYFAEVVLSNIIQVNGLEIRINSIKTDSGALVSLGRRILLRVDQGTINFEFQEAVGRVDFSTDTKVRMEWRYVVDAECKVTRIERLFVNNVEFIELMNINTKVVSENGVGEPLSHRIELYEHQQTRGWVGTYEFEAGIVDNGIIGGS